MNTTKLLLPLIFGILILTGGGFLGVFTSNSASHLNLNVNSNDLMNNQRALATSSLPNDEGLVTTKASYETFEAKVDSRIYESENVNHYLTIKSFSKLVDAPLDSQEDIYSYLVVSGYNITYNESYGYGAIYNYGCSYDEFYEQVMCGEVMISYSSYDNMVSVTRSTFVSNEGDAYE